jgi:hypothetical protein
MAASLLGASNGRIEWGDIAAFAGLSSLTVAMTIQVSGSPASGKRLFGQYGNSGTKRAFILNVDSTNELGFAIANNAAGFYGKITTDVDLANGSLYRIVAKINAASNLGAIWVNGVSRTVIEYVGSVNTVTQNSTVTVYVGHESDQVADGLDGDYSEVAAWATYVPDWFCEAYGKGFSPNSYRTNRIFYAPLLNVDIASHMRDIQGGIDRVSSVGTSAAHPSMLYSHGAA